MYIKEIDIKELESLNINSIYASTEWLSIYPKSNLVISGIFNNNNELIGSFFYYIKKQMKVLKHLSSPPYMPHCCLYYVNNSINESKKHSTNKKITKLIAEHLNVTKVNIVTLPFPPENIDMQYFYWNKYKVIPSYTYQIELNKSVDLINQNVDPKTRNLIKKANKDGLTVEQNFDNSLVEDIVLKTMERNNVSVDRQILKNILFSFSNDKNSFSFVSKRDGEPLAVTFCIYNKHQCYYILGGYNSDKSHSGAGPLAVWNSVLHAKELGINIFDFEGSMLMPVESYFRSFGGDLTPYYTVNKASFLVESMLKTKKKQLF
jgi:lipid II:glycine glycyltransferase (peptidoglycan interpeptide bridge formation enzyme)